MDFHPKYTLAALPAKAYFDDSAYYLCTNNFFSQ